MRPLIGRLADVLAWVFVTATVVALVLREVEWTWQPAIVVAAFGWYFIGPALLAAVAFAARRRWPELIGAAAVAVLMIIVEVPLFVPNFSTEAGEGYQVNVLQANLRLGSADAPHLVGELRDHHIDVLTTEELSPEEVGRLDAAGIASVLPYRFVNPHEGGDGIGIYSRFPLSDPHYNSADFDLGVESAQVAGRAGPISLIAVHITPPWPYPSHHWASELGRLHSMIEATPRSQPLIVGGDFNATYDNAQFRGLLTGGVRDTGDDLGGQPEATYPTDRFFPPVLILDHVLVRGIDPKNLDTVSLPGSDHRGLMADLFKIT